MSILHLKETLFTQLDVLHPDGQRDISPKWLVNPFTNFPLRFGWYSERAGLAVELDTLFMEEKILFGGTQRVAVKHVLAADHGVRLVRVHEKCSSLDALPAILAEPTRYVGGHSHTFVEVIDSEIEQLSNSVEWRITPPRREKAPPRREKAPPRRAKAPVVRHVDPGPPLTLDEDQQKVVDAVVARGSVLLTASAGCGKSAVIRHIVNACRDTRKVAVTALTGKAADGISGITLDKFMYSLKGKPCPEDTLLIIDEISMMSATKLGQLEKLLRLRGNRPFGGVQLMLVGDFAQLPPVDEKEGGFVTTSPLMSHFTRHTLTKNHRLLGLVDDDKKLLEILTKTRTGAHDNADLAWLWKRTRTDDTRSSEYTYVVATNAQCDSINSHFMSLLTGPDYTFETYDVCKRPVFTGRLGAKVIFTKNGEGFYNGMLGKLTAVDGPILTVTLLDGRIVKVTYVGDYDDLHIPRADKRFIPLMLAYALTVHKAQGMSIDKVTVDCRNMATTGQVYTALSRCTCLAGLRTIGLDRARINVDIPRIPYM